MSIIPEPISEVAQAICDAFNEQWPVGTAVIAVKDSGERVESVTAGEAYILGGYPCIYIDGPGNYLLERVVPFKKTVKPDESWTLDFVGIGFEGGVQSALAAVREQLPGIEISDFDVDELRQTWSEQQPDSANLLSFNRHGAWILSHAWAFRWIAYIFLSYMDEIGAEHFMRQEMKLEPALTSRMPGLMIEVSRLDWWLENQKGK